MTSELNHIEISEPILQTVVGGYIDELRHGRTAGAVKSAASRQASLEEAETFEKRWMGDPDFYEQARQAVAEAIVFSTLACSVELFDDFDRQAENLRPLEDPVLSHMRQRVFDTGIRCAVESIGHAAAQQLGVSERVARFEAATALEHL